MSSPAPELRPDPALGVFETLLVSDGRACALAAHLARLQSSLRTLYGLTLPAEIGADLTIRAAALPGPHRLRVDAVPSGAAVAIEVTVSPLAPGRAAGVTCSPVQLPGGLGAHKWRDRRWIATAATPDTVPLIVEADGSILEAAWANVWLHEGDCLVTPPADGRLLEGITRGRLIALAPGLGLTIAEEPISLHRAADSGEVFLTSSLRLAVPARIGGAGATPLPPSTPVLERIRAALSDG